MEQTEKIITALRKKLDKSGWNKALWSFWVSSEFEQIIDTLIHYMTVDRKWIPGADKMLRFLIRCPYGKLKVVMLVDMTSLTWATNNGIPMSTEGMLPNKVVQEMQMTMPGAREDRKFVADLSIWARQGVLMIPTAVTAEPGRLAHYDLWKPLIAYLINHINHNKPQVPWVLLGTKAHEWELLIKTDKIQKRLFYTPFPADGLWEWVSEQIILNNQIDVEWIK